MFEHRRKEPFEAVGIGVRQVGQADHLTHDLDSGDDRQQQSGPLRRQIAGERLGQRAVVVILDLLAADTRSHFARRGV